MPNPFYYGGHVSPERFIGRRAELAKLFSALEVVHTGQLQSISVVGPRRMGKSSLLFYAAQKYPDHLEDARNYRFTYVSLFDPECKTLDGLLGRILRGLHLNAPPQVTLIQFQNELRGLKATGGLPVILLDEFAELTEKPDQFSPDLYDMWRDLIDAGTAAFVTASAVPLMQLAEAKRYTSPFFNIFSILGLGEFAAVEAEELVQVGANCDRAFTLTEQRQMREMGGKHPYRLQLAGSLLYQAKAGNAQINSQTIRKDFDNQLVQAGLAQKANTAVRSNILVEFLTFPKMLGRAVLDALGRHDSYDSSQWFWGIVVIGVILALVLGVVKLDAVQDWLRVITGASK